MAAFVLIPKTSPLSFTYLPLSITAYASSSSEDTNISTQICVHRKKSRNIMIYGTMYMCTWWLSSLVPRPKPPCGEEGLVTFECFLGYAHHYVIVFQMVLHNPEGARAQV